MKLNFENINYPKVTCQKASLEKPPVFWPKIIETFEYQDYQLCLRPADFGDIPQILKVYRECIPHIYGSARQYLLEEDFYQTKAAMLSNWEKDSKEKAYFIGVMENIKTKEIIFAAGFHKDPYDLCVQMLATTLRPQYRGLSLTNYFKPYLEKFLTESGTDFVHGTVNTRDLVSQNIMLACGWQVAGLIPGMHRWTYDGENYHRDMMVIMYKFYNGSEAYSTHVEDWKIDEKILISLQDQLNKVLNKS